MPDPTLDPDLEQVLEDIAADPRAKLFITQPRKILTGFLDGSLETPASRTGLRPAERHLLEVYRHELGFLLRQVYLVELEERDTSIVNVHSTPAPDAIRQAISKLTTHAGGQGRYQAPLEYLRQWSEARLASPLRVLAMSMRVEVNHQSRIHLANEYVDREQARGACSLAGITARQCPGPQLRGYALMSLGGAQDLLGKKDRSLESFETAFQELVQSSKEEALIASSNIVWLAIETGDHARGLAACTWIDQHFSARSEPLSRNVRAFLKSKHKPRPDTHVLKRLSDSAGEPAQEIIHAIN